VVTIASLYLPQLPQDFDVVIIDEASQCLEVECIDALLRAKKFVMVGDDKQLQPIVTSAECIAKDMQISLFERLCK
jgi:DNA replication ATP-dependent helicase Dna2